jgi:dTMP kinase
MRFNSHPGKFIVLEGLDGSGQTTEANLLTIFLKSKGKSVIKTKEPTVDSEAGRKIREILDQKEKIDSADLQRLFAEDRNIHLKTMIIPHLEKGDFVISDRYFFSSFAFGSANGLDLEWLIKINEDFLFPDLTFFLDARPEICFQRIIKRGKERTLFEKIEKMNIVYNNYLNLTKRFKDAGVVIVNGELNPAGVFKEIKEYVKKYC